LAIALPKKDFVRSVGESNQHDSAFSPQTGNAPVLTFALIFWANDNSTQTDEFSGVPFAKRPDS
jgi:hypothetical protein